VYAMSEPVARRELVSVLSCLGGCLLLRIAGGGAGMLIGLLLARFEHEGQYIPAILVGLASALFYCAELFGAPFFGILSDRHGRRPYLLVSPIFGAVATAMMLLVPLLPLILLNRTLMGLSTAASAPASLGYLADATSGNQLLRGRVMAAFEVATVLGIIAGVASGGLLWDHFGTYAFAAILAVNVVTWLLFLNVRDVATPSRVREGSVWSVLRLPAVLAFVPAWLAVNAVLGGWFAHASFQLARDDDPTQLLVGGYTGSQVGLYATAVGVVFLIGLVTWGQLLGRLGALRSMQLSLVGMFALCPAVFLLNHSQPNEHVRIGVFLAASAAALVVGSGFTPAALAHLADISESSIGQRGAVMGLYSVLLGLGQFLGALLASPLVAWFEIDGLILATLVLVAASAVGVSILSTHQGRQRSVSHAGPLATMRAEVEP
jgi:MFS family permease